MLVATAVTSYGETFERLSVEVSVTNRASSVSNHLNVGEGRFRPVTLKLLDILCTTAECYRLDCILFILQDAEEENNDAVGDSSAKNCSAKPCRTCMRVKMSLFAHINYY